MENILDPLIELDFFKKAADEQERAMNALTATLEISKLLAIQIKELRALGMDIHIRVVGPFLDGTE